MTYDAIVIGGGIIGALAAYDLAKNGAKTLLLEKYKFGFGASGNSAAMLEFQLDAHRGDPFTTLGKASDDLFPALHQEIKTLTGIDFQLERCGILQLALNAKDATELKAEAARQQKMGLRARWLDADQLRIELPRLEPVQHGAILYEDDGQVNGSLFLSGALEAARKKGANIRENVGSISLIKKEGRVTAVKAGQEEFQAKTIVVAAGAWSDQILDVLGVQLGVEPIRGQLIIYKTPQRILPYPVYTKTGGYVTPKSNGTTLAGTTVERAGFVNEPTEEGRKSIAELARALVPTLPDHAVTAVTAGLRPKSPDDLPLIGPLPDYPNVVVAAGHFRNGVLLAPITAQIITALVLKKKTPVDISPYLPNRVISKS